MTQLKHITMNDLSFECQSCGHSPLIAVQDMIRLYGGDTTVDHVRAKARCSSCGHAPLIPVTEMIERYGAETTVDYVRAKARCSV